MADNIQLWLKRSKEMIEKGTQSPELVPFTPSMLAAVYGPQSVQSKAFESRMQSISATAGNITGAYFAEIALAHSTIQNTIGEIENGLVVNLRAQVAGEVLGELVSLGKDILADGTDPSKNVSAVLIAAAFEDLIRRMGSELAGIIGRPKLEEVITTLKTAGILKGGEIGIAQSYLKFRNDSLHADWPNVQISQVQTCVAFIESLLLKHFS